MSLAATLPPGGAGGALIVQRLVGFTRHARDNGFRVGVRETLDALAFAEEAGLDDPRALRWGLRALICSCARDWIRFDALFDAYWHDIGEKRTVRTVGGPAKRGKDGADGAGPTLLRPAPEISVEGIAGAAEKGGKRGGASKAEILARTDFRHLVSDEDQQAVYDLAERLAARMRWRLTRRYRLRPRGTAVDLRKTIHRSLGSGGVPLSLAFRRRRPRPVRLIVLLDASGSMDLYSAFFMRFIRGIVDNFDEAEAFVFHTRLAHLSSALRERDAEKTMERLSVMTQGWGGGTRIGHCLGLFNDHYAKTVLDRRSAVMILSDGYDTGPPEVLAREMARLKRRAKKVIWLNPLLGWQGYEPVAGGMAAALPHVDLFAPAHNLESLMALEPHLYTL